jgi:hypothetical protein
MTKFQDIPQSFDSILIHPTCSRGSMFTTTQLAWTIEPTTGDEVSVYSIPPEAVTATLEDNVLVFDLNDMSKVPEKAGVVIQVPQNQLTDITVDGIMNYVRVARGFKNLIAINSLGMNCVIEADLTDSDLAVVVVDTSNSLHAVTAENLSLSMSSISSKVYITGSISGGTYAGFSNELMVDGVVRDLEITGSSNMLASYDCSQVVVDSLSSSCTIMDEIPTNTPSIPCTFPGCEKTCMSTNNGACSCTEAECDIDNDLTTASTYGAPTSSTASDGSVATAAATFAVILLL